MLTNNAQSRYTLGAGERLKLRKDIDTLFQNGEAFSVFPLKVVYQFIKNDTDPTIKMGVTVSKKKFKHAVDRNLIKRRIKEIWRNNKFISDKQSNPQTLHLFFLFISHKPQDTQFSVIEQAMKNVHKKLAHILSQQA